ncbi:MAG TPA: hypothetical protein PLT66_05440, partial [Bacillota bacterium]|nr:hypothetical protein [Bacillota bacterium]
FAAFIIIVWDNQGTFNAVSIRAFYDELLELLKTQLETTAATTGIANTESIDTVITYYRNSTVLIPGFVCAYMAAMGLAGSSMTWCIAGWFNQRKNLFVYDTKWEILFSKPSAVLFLASFVVIFIDSLSGSNSVNAFYAIVYTVYYPMSLAMIYTGTRTIHRWFSRTRAMRIITAVILGFAFVAAIGMSFSFIIIIICSVGVYRILSGKDKTPWNIENV